MTALGGSQKFNLTMLMSSFISLVFCSNKRGFFYFNNMSRLIRTPRQYGPFLCVPSVSVLTVFDCTYDCNSESKFHGQGLESSSWNPESAACNPESKTVLNSLTCGETKASTKGEWLVTTREKTSRERGCGYEAVLGLQQRLPDLQNAAVCTCERLNTCPVCGNNRWKMQLSFISLIITKW